MHRSRDGKVPGLIRGELMKSTAMFAIAAMLGAALIAGAQTTTTETKIKGHNAKMVTYTGCVKTGEENTGYILAEATPIVVQRTEIATSGVETETTYALVPDPNVSLDQDVGHKVQVTGMMASDLKKKTKTKTEGHHPEKTEEKIKGNASLPQFHVVSVKDLGQPCS
jgi:hypothetical protein